MTLFDTLSQISEQIQDQRHLINSEAATIQVSVYPFIQALGYNPFSLTDVKSQYTADPRPSGGERVDYAIMYEDRPIILIEAKSVNASLSENHWRQLHDYFNAEDVRFGILTNGFEYRFFTDLQRRNIMDKQPFLTINMLQLDARLVDRLEEFRKSRFNLDQILYSARKLTVLRYVEQEFKQPSDGLIKYIAQSLSSSELTNREVNRYAPIVKEVICEFYDNLRSNRNSNVDVTIPVLQDVKPLQPVKVDLSAIEKSSPNQRLSIELPVLGKYLGVKYQATLLFNPLSKDGDTYSMSLTKIRWGEDIVSVNEAEFRAIRSINPEIKLPKWKGWDTWKLRDPRSDKLRAIRELLGDSEFQEQFL